MSRENQYSPDVAAHARNMWPVVVAVAAGAGAASVVSTAILVWRAERARQVRLLAAAAEPEEAGAGAGAGDALSVADSVLTRQSSGRGSFELRELEALRRDGIYGSGGARRE